MKPNLNRQRRPARPEHHVTTNLMTLLDRAIPGVKKEVADQERREQAQLRSQAHRRQRANALRLRNDIVESRKLTANRYWMYQTGGNKNIVARPTPHDKNTDPEALPMGNPEGYATAHEGLEDVRAAGHAA